MHLICLCATRNRPRLIENTIALFEQQQLPPEHSAYLLIYDDSGILGDRMDVGGSRQLAWRTMSRSEQEPLGAKYNRMLEQVNFTRHTRDVGYVIWHDDDVYLPWHLEAHAATLELAHWSMPSTIRSACMIPPTHERKNKRRGSGNCAGSVAIGAALMNELGCWSTEPGVDAEESQLYQCWKAAGHPSDTCHSFLPSYVYTWQRDDDLPAAAPDAWGLPLAPELDAGSAAILRQHLSVPNLSVAQQAAKN